MKKRIWLRTVLFIIIFATCLFAEVFYIEPISKEKLMLFPVPSDYRNYFFLQSIENETSIVIGDFTGSSKMVVLIVDQGSDNTIDRVVEYYPDENKFKVPKESSSIFFRTDIASLKRDIISGKVFRENYSYKMKSLETVLFKLEQGTDVIPHEDGYSVKFYDPDATSTIMSEFFFMKKYGKCDLIFKTNYYKLFRTNIIPPLTYSVYCKNSTDPVVAEVVDDLLKRARETR